MTRNWIATVIVAGLTCGCTATQNEQGTDTPAEPRDATDWELLDIGSSVSMRGLSVASESVVWVSGREGRFFRTVDGGENWQQGQVPGTEGPTLVAVGPTVTDFSIDGGRRWQPLSDEGFHSVAFAGPTLGWAAGDNGRVGRLTGYAFQPVPR